MEKRKNQAALGQCILRAAAKADRMKKKNARLGDVGKGHAGMERSYIAFISYRHLPLEMATARKLHKRIERYVIPKDLRRDGQKKPGLVFRDQDELPISSNLSANIQEALDRSQYLIVICTPETAKSAWVLREISYFLEHHDRDHVLAVLADGTPETSFPPQLTELRGESGDLLGRIEPLAANIVAPNERKRAQLFRVESLRILAALIGCPFDALFRREQRYRRRRAAIALSAAALVAAAFIGMLLNRNAEIRAQLQRALVSESRTLAALSERAYREGDYNGALRYALRALPGEGRERPYVAEPEYALSRELDLYRSGVLRYARSLEQDTVIRAAALSPAGDLLVTADEYGTLRAWDTGSGALRWQRGGAAVFLLRFFGEDGLLVLTPEGAFALDADGGELWRRDDIGMLDLTAVSADGRLALATSFLAPEGTPERASLLELASGRTLTEITLSDGAARLCAASAFSPDAARAALLLHRPEDASADLLLWDIGGGTLREIDTGLRFSAGAVSCRLRFTPEGGLLLGCDDRDGQSFVRLYDGARDWTPRWETPLETEKVTLETGGGASVFASVDLFETAAGKLVFGCKHELYLLDAADGALCWHRTLGGFLLAGRVYDNACMALVLGDGTVSFCTDDGVLSDSLGVDSFRGGNDLSLAAIAGASYPESTVALVAEDFARRVSLVRFADDPQMFKVAAFSSSVSHVTLIPSPSGSLALALGYDPSGRAVEALLLDAGSGESFDPFPLDGSGGWDDPGRLALTESGLLLSPRGALDVRSHGFTPFPDGGALVSAAGGGRVFSARLTDDGQLCFYSDGAPSAAVPCPDGAWQIEAAGGCGAALLRSEEGALALCSGDGVWTALDGTDGKRFALGADKPLLAVWDGERLTLRDLASGAESVTEGLPATTAQLLFAPGDGELLAFSEAGELCVIRCGDGALLHSSQHGALGLRFLASGARYTLADAVNEDRLLIFYDDLSRSEAICLVYDRPSRGCAGAYDAVAAYLPGRDCVLVCPFTDGVYLSPYRSRAEIIDAAEALLGGTP